MVEGPRAQVADEVEDAEEDEQVDDANGVEEDARDRGPNDGGPGVQRRGGIADCPVERSDPGVERDGETEDHTRVAEGEPEPNAERSATVVEEFAGGVVNGGQVVGVEGVAHPEGVGQDPGAEAECGSGSHAVVSCRREQEPPHDVQRDDHERHGDEFRSLCRCQASP